MQSKTKTGYKILAYVVVPAMVAGLCILRVFLVKDCYAFESCDELTITFQVIDLTKRMLQEGVLPLINLYENFGQPLIGDPVTNPFALHAIPYYFLSHPLAATINRFLIFSLTISLVTYLFNQHYFLSLPIASACAILAILLPVFNYFSLNHIHLGAPLYFVMIMIMQRRLKNNNNIVNVLGLYLSLLILPLSVSNNAFVLAIPFLFVNQFYESNFKIDKSFLIFSGLFFAVLIFTLPYFYYFISVTPLCDRYNFDYTTLLPYTPLRLLKDLVFFYSTTPLLHVTICIYYSLALIVIFFAGLVSIKDRSLFYKIFLLGFLPLLAVLLLLAFPGVRSALPFIKQFDIVRMLWYTNIFLLIGVGYGLKYFQERPLSLINGAILLFLLVFSIYALRKSTYNPFTFLGLEKYIIIIGGTTLISIILSILIFKKSYKLILGFIILFLSFMPVMEFCVDTRSIGLAFITNQKIPCNSYYFSESSKAQFHPRKFIQDIKPFSRITVQYDPYGRKFIQCDARVNFFGSDARAPFKHGGLKHYLMARGLIKPTYGGMAYYFTSHDLDQLSLLGIKYIITAEVLYPAQSGWRLKNLTIDENSPGYENTFLYENPRDLSTAYIKQGHEVQYLHNIKYQGNDIIINLDKPEINKENELVLTFVNWPGWKAYIDGKPTKIYQDSGPFLRVKLPPGSKVVKFSFEPFTISQIIFFIILSFVVVFLISLSVKYTGRSKLHRSVNTG